MLHALLTGFVLACGLIFYATDVTASPADPASGYNQRLGFGFYPMQVLHQPDGKVLLIGDFRRISTRKCFGIARLNADATLDASFQIDKGVDGFIWDAALDSDGKILIVGDFKEFCGIERKGIARLNDDGTLDETFIPSDLGDQSGRWAVAVDSSNRVIVSCSSQWSPKTLFTRLLSDGSLDSAFGPVLLRVSDMLQLPDGRILCAAIGGLYVLSESGSILSPNGYSCPSSLIPRLLQIDNEGSVFCVADPGFTNGFSTVLRYDSEGSQDNGYTISTSGRIVSISTLNGTLAIGGTFSGITTHTDSAPDRRFFAVVAPDGSIDDVYDVAGGFDHYVSAVAFTSDGALALGGAFTLYGDQPCSGVAQLDQNGYLMPSADWCQTGGAINGISTSVNGGIIVAGDYTSFNYAAISISPVEIRETGLESYLDNFNIHRKRFNGAINCVAVQSGTGTVVLGGDFTSVNSTATGRIATVTSDGSYISPIDGFDGPVSRVAWTRNGKVLVVGDFSKFGNNPVSRLARLNGGALDSSFFHGDRFDHDVLCVSELPDGSLIIGGKFTKVDGQIRNHLAKLLPNGTLDPGFTSGSDGPIHDIVQDGNGDVFLAGNFTEVAKQQSRGLAKIALDGSLCPEFDIGTGFDVAVLRVVAQADGKIVVGGSFTMFDGSSAPHLTRLNLDGSRDLSFSPVEYPNGMVKDLVLRSDGRIWVAGEFTRYGGGAYFGLVLIEGGGGLAPIIPDILEIQSIASYAIDIVWQNVRNEDGYFLERRKNGGDWETVAALPRDVTNFSDREVQAASEYEYRVSAFNGIGQSFWSVASRVTTPGTFAYWLSKNGLPVDSGHLDDLDFDGIPLFLECALMLDPLGFRWGSTPSVVNSSEYGRVLLKFARPLGAIDILYEIGLSSDLKSWLYFTLDSQEVSIQRVETDAGYAEEVSVTCPSAFADSDRVFFIVRVSPK